MTVDVLERPTAEQAASVLGSEAARVFTPPLRDLVPTLRDEAGIIIRAATSDGFSVIEFAEGVLKLKLLPWQKWLLIHALELLPNGRYRFRYVVLLVARQNGKSTVSQVLALWWLYVGGRLGVLGVAQDLGTAEEIWEDAVDLAEAVPALQSEILKVWRRNGKKELVLRKSFSEPTRRGPAWKVKAANRRAGRGLTADGILMDELREQQTWEAWAAITKTATAKPNAQVWGLSNAGDSTSVVLRKLRLLGHESAGDPDGIVAAERRMREGVEFEDADEDPDEDPDAPEIAGAVGLFEWSGTPGCRRDDVDAIAAANPALGHDLDGDGVELGTLTAAAAVDDEWEYRTEHLCQWPDGVLSSEFVGNTWNDSRDPRSCILPGAKVCAAVDMSGSRQWTYIAFAGPAGVRLPDGTVIPREDFVDDDGRTFGPGVHVEIVARRGGDEWVWPWLTDPKRVDRIELVTGQFNGAPISRTIRTLAEAHEKKKLVRGVPNPEHFPVEVTPWEGMHLAAWFGVLHDGVRDGNVWHLPQPVLDVPAALGRTRRAGDGKMWDRLGSPVDIASVVAATGAVGLWLSPRPKKRVSAYAAGASTSI